MRTYPSIPDPEKLSPSEILCKAGELIEQVGWTKNKLSNEETGAVCIIGAINAVLTGSALTGSPFSTIKDNLINELYYRIAVPVGHSVADWNDPPNRTKEEVLSVLKKDC